MKCVRSLAIIKYHEVLLMPPFIGGALLPTPVKGSEGLKVELILVYNLDIALPGDLVPVVPAALRSRP